MSHMLETRLATLQLHGSGLIEQRFRPGVSLDPGSLEENQRARLALVPKDAYVVLCVVPADATVLMKRMEAEAYGTGGEERRLKALAILAEDALGRTMVEVYFRYFTSDFPVKVFDAAAEVEAKEWLVAHLEGSVS